MAEVDTILVLDKDAASREVATISKAIKTIGLPADAKSTATDTTPITQISILKQISASVQLAVFGAGTAAAAQRVTLASDGPGVTALGATNGAAVVTDADGSIQQYLRGLVTRWASALGAGTAAAALRVTLASDGPGVAALGATNGAAVITDADGSLQQYLRGLVKQWIAGTLVIGTGANVIGKIDHSSTGIGHGVKTVAAAGTAEALAGSTAAKWVTVQAQTDNTGFVAVGGSGVLATVATGTGVLLAAGDAVTLPIDNLADVFIDATVTTDGARYTYGT